MFNTTIIKISKLAQKAGVPYFQIYRRKVGDVIRELEPNTKTKIFNALWKEVKEVAKELGFDVTATRREN